MQNLKYSNKTLAPQADVTDVPPLILEAEDLHSQGNTQAASARFIEALEAYPTNTRAWNGLGVCLFQLGEHQAAVEAFEAALVLDPEDLPAMANLNQAHWTTGYRAEAVFVARRLAQYIPNSQEVWHQLFQTGVESSDHPEALLVSTGVEMGNVFANVAMALEAENFVIRGLGPDLTTMLSSTGDSADLKVIQHVMDTAKPDVVVLSAAMPALAVVQSMAMENGIPVLLLGGWCGPGAPEGVIGVPLNANDEILSEISRHVGAVVHENEGNANTETGSPLITVVVEADTLESPLVDCLDSICFQGIHPCLFEVVVLSENATAVRAELAQNRPPFSMTIASSGASMDDLARGKVVVNAPIESLHEPGALLRRICETAQS
ncbi:MAG: tetratricopeptide repeat protein [Myxococcota bacterium]|nr:tetratricopeptide repeat protein [Myxococcota bacterium]